MAVRPLKQAKRRSSWPGDAYMLKDQERQMESEVTDDPNEFGPRIADDSAPGEFVYTDREKREDQDLQRAKNKGRSRIPGRQGLQFKEGGAVYDDPNEKYWADEEEALRKRGIDPMAVDQIKPYKLPTHGHSTTLHLKGGKVGTPVKYRKGGMVCREYKK